MYDRLEIRWLIYVRCFLLRSYFGYFIFFFLAHIQFRNGANDKSPLLGTFCGTEILRTIKSFSNHLYLRFRSDQDSNHKGKDGFNSIFEEKNSVYNRCFLIFFSQDLKLLMTVHQVVSFTIKKYLKNSLFCYKIEFKLIRMRWIIYQYSKWNNCKCENFQLLFDFMHLLMKLKYYSPFVRLLQTIRKLNWPNKIKKNISTNRLYIYFTSESYMDNMQCDYTVHVSRGSSIKLQLIDVDMEITQGCIYDYVAVSISVTRTNECKAKTHYIFPHNFFFEDSWWAHSSIKFNRILLSFRANRSNRIFSKCGVCSICFGYQYKWTWFWFEILRK